MMNLRDLVTRYAALAANFGDQVALDAFGLTAQETQSLFSGLDEDYHISRFLHFSRGTGKSYVISGEEVTQVQIDEGIRALL